MGWNIFFGKIENFYKSFFQHRNKHLEKSLGMIPNLEQIPIPRDDQ